IRRETLHFLRRRRAAAPSIPGTAMSGRQPRVVILGGGPAGISAAWRLSKLGVPTTVVERDSAVGGMGKTIQVGRYFVDYGPHTFHIRETDESRAIHEAIRPLFGE